MGVVSAWKACARAPGKLERKPHSMRRGAAERVAPARRRLKRRRIRRAAPPEAPARAGSAWWRRRKGCLVDK